MGKERRRFSEQVMLTCRPAMRADLEQIAAELDIPLSQLLREWTSRAIESHKRAKRREKQGKAVPESVDGALDALAEAAKAGIAKRREK